MFCTRDQIPTICKRCAQICASASPAGAPTKANSVVVFLRMDVVNIQPKSTVTIAAMTPHATVESNALHIR